MKAASSDRERNQVNQQPKNQDWAGITEGDSQAWRRLLETLIPRLYGFFLNRWANRSLAEELVQKTVFDAVRGLRGYDEKRGNVEEWLFGIARNNIRLEIRRRATRPSVDGDISEYIERIESELVPDEILERKETAQIVRAALDTMDEKDRYVLKAKYVDGLSAMDIANQINVTEKAVHSLLYRARQSLRTELRRIAPLKKEEQKNET